jgi:hypothetical protein
MHVFLDIKEVVDFLDKDDDYNYKIAIFTLKNYNPQLNYGRIRNILTQLSFDLGIKNRLTIPE